MFKYQNPHNEKDCVYKFESEIKGKLEQDFKFKSFVDEKFRIVK